MPGEKKIDIELAWYEQMTGIKFTQGSVNVAPLYLNDKPTPPYHLACGGFLCWKKEKISIEHEHTIHT